MHLVRNFPTNVVNSLWYYLPIFPNTHSLQWYDYGIGKYSYWFVFDIFIARSISVNGLGLGPLYINNDIVFSMLLL